MSTKDCQDTVAPAKRQLQVIYNDNHVSDEAKEAFVTAYNDLEQHYLQLKKNLSTYLSTRSKPSKQS